METTGETVNIKTSEIERPLSIALCGIRGIPACYGGFETFAEEIATRLVQRGHRVRVYGRKHVIDCAESEYRGVQLKLLPAPRHKYFETPVHSLFCFLHLVFHRVDVVLVCNAANSPFLWVLRLGLLPVAINLDGIERHRAKWNWLGKLWYRLGEICSVLFANRLVADAEVIRKYYLQTYKANSEVIPYGFQETAEEAIRLKLAGEEIAANIGQEALFSELGVEPGKYLLYVSRLEPENNPHVVIAAYNRLSATDKRYPLLIVGDAPYAQAYIQSLRELAGLNVIFAGFRFGADYRALQLGAYLYVQATEVGGTHPALVEAMGFGNCVVANDTPENHEVVENAGLYYRKNDTAALSDVFSRLLVSDDLVRQYRQAARQHVLARYSWDKITSQYSALFQQLVAQR